MSYVVLEHGGWDSPHDVLFVVADLKQADRVADALNRHTETSNFFVEHVPDVAPDQAAIKYRGREVRVDYWRPPAPRGDGPGQAPPPVR